MRLHNGDCLEKLKELADNSIDAIVTDPPYGLSFMNKHWDYDIPTVELWKEALRVLKPGGHLLSFGGTRTYHRMVVNIEDAGFEIRDQVQWIYGQGFPKSHNIEKATGDEKYKGFGTALKPANEPICLARKPLEKGLTIAENVLKWGVGGLNIDATRIGRAENDRTEYGVSGDEPSSTGNENTTAYGKYDRVAYIPDSQGRFPANLILDETAAEMLDEQSGLIRARNGYGVKGQTGGGTGSSYKMTKCDASVSQKVIRDSENGTLAGASRFFYVAKASKSERNKGLEGMPAKKSGIKNDSGRGFSEGDPYKEVLNQNFHPTVKPVKLMEYLCKLITPPQGTVLDPFMGSGTTGVACKNLGFGFVGIERDKEYFEISKKRVKAETKPLNQMTDQERQMELAL